jgi:hypothetical protein
LPRVDGWSLLWLRLLRKLCPRSLRAEWRGE